MTANNVTGWRKSSRSAAKTDCVEVGRAGESGAAVRDTKDRAAGHFAVSSQAWGNFLNAIKADRYNA